MDKSTTDGKPRFSFIFCMCTRLEETGTAAESTWCACLELESCTKYVFFLLSNKISQSLPPTLFQVVCIGLLANKQTILVNFVMDAFHQHCLFQHSSNLILIVSMKLAPWVTLSVNVSMMMPFLLQQQNNKCLVPFGREGFNTTRSGDQSYLWNITPRTKA